jgi:hypothetical protein
MAAPWKKYLKPRITKPRKPSNRFKVTFKSRRPRSEPSDRPDYIAAFEACHGDKKAITKFLTSSSRALTAWSRSTVPDFSTLAAPARPARSESRTPETQGADTPRMEIPQAETPPGKTGSRRKESPEAISGIHQSGRK